MNRTPNLSRALATVVTASLLLLAGHGAHAEGAVVLQNWNNGVGNTPALSIGETLTATKSLAKSNYSDNPDLDYSAWAHAGGTPWYTFQLTETADVTISLNPVVAGVTFNPGLTVWASGSTVFDGGSELGDEVGYNGWFTPHSFNATGQLGTLGTYWMSSDGTTTYGNMKETLAYAVSGESHTSDETGWGESILHGVHDVSVDNVYESGVTGSVGDNWLQLTLLNLQPGYYVIFMGGTNQDLTAQNYLLSASAVASVPEPATWAALLAGLAVLSGARRARRRA
jgi:hypothetical protein